MREKYSPESKIILCSSFPFIYLVVSLYIPVYTTYVLKQKLFSNLSKCKNYSHVIVINPTTEMKLDTTIHKHELVLHVSDLFGHLQGGARGGKGKAVPLQA